MTEHTAEPDETTEPAGVSPETPDPEPDDETTEEEPEETFPRSYVEQLRQEAAEHRVRAQDRDELASQLWSARVAATGRLADPTDLPMPDGADVGQDAVQTAVDELLSRKPHLASRRPAGDVGQGATESTGAVDLAGMLRARA